MQHVSKLMIPRQRVTKLDIAFEEADRPITGEIRILRNKKFWVSTQNDDFGIIQVS